MSKISRTIRLGILPIALALQACALGVAEGDRVQAARDLWLLSEISARPRSECRLPEGSSVLVSEIHEVYQGAGAETVPWVHVTGGPIECPRGYAVWDTANFRQ